MSSSNEKNDNSCNKQAETDDVSRKRSREEDKQEEGGEQKKVAKEKVPVVFIRVPVDDDSEYEIFFREDGEISMQLEMVFDYATQNQNNRDIVDQVGTFVHSAISENEHSERWIDEHLFSGDSDSDIEGLKAHFNNPRFLKTLVDRENGKWTHISEGKLDKNNGFFGFNGKPCRVYMFK